MWSADGIRLQIAWRVSIPDCPGEGRCGLRWRGKVGSPGWVHPPGPVVHKLCQSGVLRPDDRIGRAFSGRNTPQQAQAAVRDDHRSGQAAPGASYPTWPTTVGSGVTAREHPARPIASMTVTAPPGGTRYREVAAGRGSGSAFRVRTCFMPGRVRHAGTAWQNESSPYCQDALQRARPTLRRRIPSGRAVVEHGE
jgi:hypothetical protein